MATKKVLVTGGAGFIGSHLVDALVEKGHAVTVLDSMEPQVHRSPPAYLNPGATYVTGDVGDRAVLDPLLLDADLVSHQASVVGVGQSMYEVERYVRKNTLATSTLWQALVDLDHDVRKLVVASSMSIYGEGQYRCSEHGAVSPGLRPDAQMAKRDWEMHCPSCDRHAEPTPTAEGKPLQPNSTYALTKLDQEVLCLALGRAYGLPVVALRYFNVYGPRQALENPYTGVAAIFSARIRNGHPPVVFEDGRQTRDFISVKDVVRANLLALANGGADGLAVNVGTGVPTSIRQVAEVLIRLEGASLQPVVEHKFRSGDVRHCVADARLLEAKLGFRAKVAFAEGMKELAAWTRTQRPKDEYEKAHAELKKYGLVG